MEADSDFDGPDSPGTTSITSLHRAYLASVREHSHLVAELCTTLVDLGAALESAGIAADERTALTERLTRHVRAARAIVSGLDGALGRAPPSPAGLH